MEQNSYLSYEEVFRYLYIHLAYHRPMLHAVLKCRTWFANKGQPGSYNSYNTVCVRYLPSFVSLAYRCGQKATPRRAESTADRLYDAIPTYTLDEVRPSFSPCT